MLVGRIDEARLSLEYVSPDITEEQLRDIEVGLSHRSQDIVHALHCSVRICDYLHAVRLLHTLCLCLMHRYQLQR
jgi:hypothetical protein